MDQFEQKELFENQPSMIGRPASIQLFEVIALFGKVDAVQTEPQTGKAVRFENLVRQRIVDIRREIVKRRCYKPPKLAARDSRCFFVYGHVTANIERTLFIVLVNQLELRIEKHQPRLIAVQIDAAKEHNVAAGAEITSLEVCAVKPFRVNEAAAVRKNHVQNSSARPRFDNPAAIDVSTNRGILAHIQRRKRNEIGPILIGLRDVQQK